jgi:hypothetical protein
MRTYIEITQELALIEKELEKNGNKISSYKKWKKIGESIQLEQFKNDFFELQEWIKKHENKIDIEKLISKIHGEVIM